MIKVSLARINHLSTYQIVNSILALFIVLSFCYSAVFSPAKSGYPIHSAHTIISGEDSASTGLSRGFSSIVRFQFEQARDYNPYSIQVFLFFLVQLIMRIFITMTYFSLIEKLGVRKSVVIDSIISGVLLLVLFEPFWREISAFLTFL